MTDSVTFENFNPRWHEVYEIGEEIGARGVILEIANAFGHDLSAQLDEENLGELIAKVGPAKTLQDNIAHAQDVLGEDSVHIARDWVARSGLLDAVERSYVWPSEPMPEQFAAAVITGGVRNWMQRRADVLIASGHTGPTFLVAGNRQMRETEGPDVEPGMTEADYMIDVIRPKLKAAGGIMKLSLLPVESAIGDEVFASGATLIAREAELQDPRKTLLVASNAGAWVQNAGQLRRAFRKNDPHFDRDGDQLFVASDSFELGTGTEPTSTHQNPLSALGIIVRNAQELVRHSR